jgi:hypothetical protein
VVSRDTVDAFFNKYVYGFMFTDIQREIALARLNLGGGNFLAALGLLCYTEFLGGVKRDKLQRRESKRNFDAFFKTLGPEYAALLTEMNVYDVFRCGMAHEYFVKRNCVIAMLKGGERCGLGCLPGGGLYFVVERYFEDFADVCRTLHEQLSKRPPLGVLQVTTLGVPIPGKRGPSIRFFGRPDPMRLNDDHSLEPST